MESGNWQLRTAVVSLLILLVGSFILGACAGPRAKETPLAREEAGELENENAAGNDDNAENNNDDDEDDEDEDPEVTMPVDLVLVYRGQEHQVEREVPETEDAAGAALEAMREGFVYDGQTVYPLPQGTRVLGVDVLDGIAYADFSRELKDNHWGGVQAEVNTIYSVVHTLSLAPQVEQVQFLVEGAQVETIATGAVPLTEPLRPLPDISSSLYRQLEEEVAAWQQPEAEAILAWDHLVEEEGSRVLGYEPVRDACWADLDGDEELDVVFALPGGVVALQPDGDGGFAHAWEAWVEDMQGVEAADTTGDGQDEILALTDDSMVLYLRDGKEFVQGYRRNPPHGITQVLAGDTTGNEKAEVILLSGRGDPSSDDYQALVEVWRHNQGSYQQAFKSDETPFRYLALGDITEDPGEEMLALGQESATVFSWSGEAYVERYRKPQAGGMNARPALGDITGDGRREVVLADCLEGGIYVYSWQDEQLVKVWQGAGSAGNILEQPPQALDLSGNGRREVVLPAAGEGGFLLLSCDGDEVLAAQLDRRGKNQRLHGMERQGDQARLLYSYQAPDGTWHLAWGQVRQERLQALWDSMSG